MDRIAKHFLAIVITIGTAFLTFSCIPTVDTTVIPRIKPQHTQVVEKFPYKITFIVDKESLNKIYEIKIGAYIIYSAMGRVLSIQYKEFLDKHFEDAVIVWGEDQEVLKKCDLKTRIIIDDYYAKIPFAPGINEGTFHMAVTCLIEPIDGSAIVAKKMTDIETGLFAAATAKNDADQIAFMKKAVTSFTADAVHNMFSKFSLELQASPKLHILDFKDMEGFLQVLDASDTPMSKFICSKLSPFIREELHNFKTSSDKKTAEKSEKSNAPKWLRAGLIDQLNNILEKETLQDVALKTGIKVSDEKGQHASGLDKMHINRLLFEKAYSPYVEMFDTSIYDQLKSLHG